MLESAVDRLGGSVGGAGSVEVRQDVIGALLQRLAQGAISLSAAGRLWLTELDQPFHGCPAWFVGFAVGGDHPLVDRPGRLNLNVGVAVEFGW